MNHPSVHRCQTIPVVSRSWLRIHKAYPPHRKCWNLDCEDRVVSKAMVIWLRAVAGSLEELQASCTLLYPTGSYCWASDDIMTPDLGGGGVLALHILRETVS